MQTGRNAIVRKILQACYIILGNYITGFLSACLNHIKLEKEYSPCK